MHPAPSLVLFTVAAGMGYGILIVLGIAAPFGLAPESQWFRAVSLGLALGLISIGLAASTFHLGHPERAWRALSQWRTSWLSREGVAAVATYGVAAPFALGWVFWPTGAPLWAVFALLTAVGAAGTIVCTSMIYASLKPIRQWHSPWVPPLFAAFSLGTGAIWLSVVARLFGVDAPWIDGLAMVALAVAWGLNVSYWLATAQGGADTTPETATGLGHLGRVRALEDPHTEPNYLLREMGYRIARKHARPLRRLAVLTGGPVPVVLVLAAQIFPAPADIVSLLLAAFSATLGAVVGRWLFFAEATHTLTHYYTRPGR